MFFAQNKKEHTMLNVQQPNAINKSGEMYKRTTYKYNIAICDSHKHLQAILHSLSADIITGQERVQRTMQLNNAQVTFQGAASWTCRPTLILLVLLEPESVCGGTACTKPKEPSALM